MPKTKDNIVLSDLEALKESHQLVRDDNFDEEHCADWKVRMARRYYNKLFKEYAIIDLSKYKEGKYGLRWRTEAEVMNRKGQAICASKECDVNDLLSIYELPFKYAENGEVKRELIKLCLCSSCSLKLNYCNEKSKKATGATATEETQKSEASSRKRKSSSVSSKIPNKDDAQTKSNRKH